MNNPKFLDKNMDPGFLVWQEVHHDKMVEENNKLRAKIKELEAQNESKNNN